MSLSRNLEIVQKKIKEAQERSGRQGEVKIVAVTKTHPTSVIEDAHRLGLFHIGENKVQEAGEKFRALASETKNRITRHMVGHLQTNKINKALDLFDTIDSVDSVRLAEKINRRATELKIKIPILLEINTSGESSKQGFSVFEEDKMLSCFVFENLQIKGLMTIGPLTNYPTKIRSAFTELRKTINTLNRNKQPQYPELTELSMGMSDDYEVAVEEGSTMVRLGTKLFGKRIL